MLLLEQVSGTNYAEYKCLRNSNDSQLTNWIYVVYNLSSYLVLPVPILCFNYSRVVRTLLTSIKRSRQMTGDLR